MDTRQAPYTTVFTPLAEGDDLGRCLRDSHRDVRLWPIFLRMLLEWRVFVFAEGPPAAAGPADDAMTILSWNLDDGEIVIPVFTSLSELQRYGNGSHAYHEILFSDLREACGETNLLINPSTPFERSIRADQILAQAFPHLGNPVYKKFFENTEMHAIGHPLDFPFALAKAVRIVCAFYTGISTGFIMAIQKPQDVDSLHYVIGLSIESGDRDAIVRAIYNVAEKNIPVEHEVSVIALDGDEYDEYMRMYCKPFYRRSLDRALSSLNATVQLAAPEPWWKQLLASRIPFLGAHSE